MTGQFSLYRLLRSLITLLPLAALVLLGTPPAHSAPVEVFTRHFHGLFLNAQTFTQDDCIRSGQTLFADRTQVVYVSSTNNSCTGERSQIMGSAIPTVFMVTSHLGSGHVVATIPLTDVNTGAPAGELTIDETFSGTPLRMSGNQPIPLARSTIRVATPRG